MIVTCVTVFVKEENVEEFIEATLENHRASVREPGNLRFDFLQSEEDPSRFLLYEAYDSEEAAKAHKETGHYLEWRRKVADWMAKPRRGDKHAVVAPLDRSMW